MRKSRFTGEQITFALYAPLMPWFNGIRCWSHKVIVVSVALLAGCASVTQKSHDPETVARIQRIVLLDVVGPQQYRVSNVGSVSSAFGLVGAVAEIGTEGGRSKEFDSTIRQNFDAAAYMRAELTKAVEARGYKVRFLPDQHPIVKDGKGDYSAIETNGDPILEVAFFQAGYVSEQFSTKYDPHIQVFARLGAAETGELLYFQAYNYGAKVGSSKGIKYLPPVSKSEFGTYRDLMDDIAETVVGLRGGVEVIAQDIAGTFPVRGGRPAEDQSP
jgi:hypothetical protein